MQHYLDYNPGLELLTHSSALPTLEFSINFKKLCSLNNEMRSHAWEMAVVNVAQPQQERHMNFISFQH